MSNQGGTDIDPYKVLSLPKNFTVEQLRSQYKKIALSVHPDKPGGSEYLFKMVTACYKKLAKQIDMRKMDKQYHQLKTESAAYIERQQPTAPKKSNVGTKQFDAARFNQLFEKHRLPDVNDDGYGSWMAPSTQEREDIDIKNTFGKYNTDSFNKRFDEIPIKSTTKVSRFAEPTALASSAGVPCSELGVSKVSDFSAPLITGKSLNYMDYKRAHSTTRLIDSNKVSVKEWRSVEELEHDRAKTSFVMSDDQRRAYERQRYEQDLREKKRLENLRMRDNVIEKHYNQLNKLMLR
jgi:curved DNA-binding protein CbpA